MELQRFIEALQADLEGIAAGGDDAVSEAAGRLTTALRASAGLRLLDVLGEAALELTSQLPNGAAAREGVSVNTWLIRALARAVGSGGPRRGPGNRLTGFGRS